jgi:peptide/nickel transport system permease protein
MVGLILVLAVFAPLIAPYDPERQLGDQILVGPSWDHLFGTDNLGRDVFSRIIYGARLSWFVGITAVGIGAAAGVTMGVMAGYFGSVVDNTIMRLVDIILAFPGLVFLITLVGILGASLENALIAIGIGMTPSFARVARGQVLTVKEAEFVLAARSLGASDARLILRHILPNIMAIVIVQISLSFSLAILAETTLSFLGLGAQPPEPSWGATLNLTRSYLELAPWLGIFPGLAVMISVLGFNQLGDGLRDVLDPRLRGQG